MAILFNNNGIENYVKIDMTNTYMTPEALYVGFTFYPNADEREKEKIRLEEFELIKKSINNESFQFINTINTKYKTSYTNIEEKEINSFTDEEKVTYYKLANTLGLFNRLYSYLKCDVAKKDDEELNKVIESFLNNIYFENLEKHGFKREYLTDPIYITASGYHYLCDYEEGMSFNQADLYKRYKDYHGDRVLGDI